MNTTKILVLGSSGLIGSNFLRLIPIRRSDNRLDLEFTDGLLSGKLLCPPHNQVDISNFKQTKEYIELNKPNVIINFAAYRDATSAELERGDKKGIVWKSNVTGIKNLTKLASKNNCYLIHVSTDMVFSGKDNNKGPYNEYSITETSSNNLSWYGWTKKLGEDFIINNCTKYAILRIGNVTVPIYDPKLDYIGKIVWLYNNSSLYPLFEDQRITITYIPDLAKAIKMLLLKNKRGIFHISSGDLVSPFQLANYVIRSLGGNENENKGCQIGEYLAKYPNRYPKFGGLSTSVTEKVLKLKFLKWRKIADNFVKYMKIMDLN